MNTKPSKRKPELTEIQKEILAVCYDWGAIGDKRGFKITRILLVPHGSQHNDTICTVDVKINRSLDSFVNEREGSST